MNSSRVNRESWWINLESCERNNEIESWLARLIKCWSFPACLGCSEMRLVRVLGPIRRYLNLDLNPGRIFEESGIFLCIDKRVVLTCCLGNVNILFDGLRSFLVSRGWSVFGYSFFWEMMHRWSSLLFHSSGVKSALVYLNPISIVSEWLIFWCYSWVYMKWK